MDSPPVNQSKITVKILPNAPRDEIVSFLDGIWRIKIAAPPEKGKANKELIAFLGETLGIRKDAIVIIKGQTSHHKLIGVLGLAPQEINSRLLSRKS